MKKGVIVFSLILIVLLSTMLVSASSFSDWWNNLFGKNVQLDPGQQIRYAVDTDASNLSGDKNYYAKGTCTEYVNGQRIDHPDLCDADAINGGGQRDWLWEQFVNADGISCGYNLYFCNDEGKTCQYGKCVSTTPTQNCEDISDSTNDISVKGICVDYPNGVRTEHPDACDTAPEIVEKKLWQTNCNPTTKTCDAMYYYCPSGTECKGGECVAKQNEIQNDGNFTLIYNGSWPGKKIKLYFINFGYDNYSLFEHDVNYSLFADDVFEGWDYKGLLNAEPYKTYRERFDIYQINKPLNESDIGCSITNTEKPCNVHSIFTFARSTEGLNLGNCQLSSDYTFIDVKYSLVNCNALILFIKNRNALSSYPDAAGKAGSDLLHLIVEDERNFPGDGIKKVFIFFLHESGHLFGGILDEYWGGYAQGKDYSNLDLINRQLEGTNCDVKPGCPSWCSGEAKKVQRTDDCFNLKTEEQCNSYLRNGDGTWGGNACVWITNQELVNYFGSNCIPEVPRGEVFSWNSGNNCEDGKGCFYGCRGNGWRSTERSLYAGLIEGTPNEWNTYSKNGLEPYNTLQKTMIQNRIELITNDVSGADKPISMNIIRDRMVWDLPELTGFSYGGGWNFKRTNTELTYHIDLRYTNIDQRSEFMLDIINLNTDSNIMVPLPDSFLDEQVNEERSVWGDMSLKEINGNKIFEGTADSSAGKQRYVLWISGNNFIRGWNGNDAGTVIDNVLFDTLLNAYLDKYPSTYTGSNAPSITDSSKNIQTLENKNFFQKIVIWFKNLFKQ